MANTVKYNIFLNNQKFKIANKSVTTEQTEQSFTIPNVGQADTASNITLTNGVSTTLTLKRNSTGSIGVYLDSEDLLPKLGIDSENLTMLCYNQTTGYYCNSDGYWSFIDDTGDSNWDKFKLEQGDTFTIYLINLSPSTTYETFFGTFTQQDFELIYNNIDSYSILFKLTHNSGDSTIKSSTSTSVEIGYDRVIDLVV